MSKRNKKVFTVNQIPRAIEMPSYPVWPILDKAKKEALKGRIKKLMKEQNAILVAHYYTDNDLQDLAEETGGCVSDSLEMARFGANANADTLIVCGVRFMGETSKILNPEKRVLMPDTRATCSLDEGCPSDEFSVFCDHYPDHIIVVYANTSAAVKSRADWMVTSGIGLQIIRHLKEQNKKIIWAPDRHLGTYINRITGANMLLWKGSCIVHEEFNSSALKQMRILHSDAAVLVHPESSEKVIKQADVVGSTTTLIQAVVEMNYNKFIIATDKGIFWKMKKLAPGKRLILAPTAGKGGASSSCESCGHCPWMAMNSLYNLEEALLTNKNEILLEEEICAHAILPIRRMLNFAREYRREA